MHIFIATQGIKRLVDKFMQDLGAWYLPYKKEGVTHVELGVRPIQLWELIIPEESYETVMRSIHMNANGSMTSSDERKLSFTGKQGLSMLRKALGAKPCPKWNKEGEARLLTNGNVGVLPIGVRKDKRSKDGVELL